MLRFYWQATVKVQPFFPRFCNLFSRVPRNLRIIIPSKSPYFILPVLIEGAKNMQLSPCQFSSWLARSWSFRSKEGGMFFGSWVLQMEFSLNMSTVTPCVPFRTSKYSFLKYCCRNYQLSANCKFLETHVFQFFSRPST